MDRRYIILKTNFKEFFYFFMVVEASGLLPLQMIQGMLEVFCS